LLLSFENNA